MSENGVGRGDTGVAGQREIESAAHAVAANCGDYGLGAIFDHTHYRLSERGKSEGFDGGECGNFHQFGAGGETFFSSGDYGGGEIRRRDEARELVANLLEGGLCEAGEIVGGG